MRQCLKPWRCSVDGMMSCLVCLIFRVLRRPRSSRNGRSKAARPVSMFCDEQGWPIIQPSQAPPSEWLSTSPVRVSEPAISDQHPAKDSRASENYLEMCKVIRIRLFY